MRSETFADLLKHDLALAYHCQPCGRWRDVDLRALVRAGRGDERYVGRRPVCAVCGERGDVAADRRTPSAPLNRQVPARVFRFCP